MIKKQEEKRTLENSIKKTALEKITARKMHK